MNLSRTEDQAGLFGTILFHALLVFLLMLMMVKCQDDPIDDPMDGAVSVSLGEPDYGGPDNSTAETSVAEPQPQEPTVEEQVTSEVDGAPEVQNTETPSTSNPTTTTPDPPKDPEREVDDRATWKPGSGDGSGDGDKTGDEGEEDGKPDGKPDGTGGDGTQGTGQSGNGWNGNISGFKIDTHIPSNDKQEFGMVKIDVCVDKKGNVLSATVARGTKGSLHLQRLSIAAVKRSKYTRTGKATNRNCGYIIFNYKAG